MSDAKENRALAPAGKNNSSASTDKHSGESNGKEPDAKTGRVDQRKDAHNGEKAKGNLADQERWRVLNGVQGFGP